MALWCSREMTELEQGDAVRELLSSGIFDHEFYATVARLADQSPHDLAHHYLSHGVNDGLAPHPLIEFDYMPPPVRAARTEEHGASRLIAYLRSEPARMHPWGPLFDPRRLEPSAVDPLELLGNWPSGQALPVPEGFLGAPPTLQDAKDLLVNFVERHRNQFNAALPSRRSAWDRQGTREWVSRVTTDTESSTARVSVIMPVLNRAGVIGTAIESVLSQSHSNLELIVIDDGSTDETRDVIRTYAKADSRVRLLSGPHIGVAAARNTGLSQVKGDFVAFLDSDNSWTRRFLELSLRGLSAAPEAVAAHAGLRLHGDEGDVSYRGGPAQYDDLQIGNSIDLNVLVVRARSMTEAGLFDISLRRWVDYDLVLRLSKAGRLEYLPFIGCEYDNKTAEGRITQKETLHWQWAVREKHLIDWKAVRADCAMRVAERTSIVLVIAGSTGHTMNSVDGLLAGTGDDREVLIVDNGSRSSVGRKLVARYISEPRVRYLRLPVNNNFAVAANYGFSLSTGAQVAFLDSDADPRDGWLDALSRRKAETGAMAVQALLVNTDYTVQHAGYAFYDRVQLPCALFAGLTIDDANHADLGAVTAISASATLFDADQFADLNGFDALFANGLEDVDLCLRARQDLGSAAIFASAPDAIVVHHNDKPSASRQRREAENRRIYSSRWSQEHLPDDRERYRPLSLSVTGLAPLQGSAHPAAIPVLARSRTGTFDESGTAAPSLRWAIKTGVPSTRGGDRWGDIPFAADLSAALRTRGQQVVTDRHEAWNRPSAYLDDVVLTLRGRHRIPPQPGAANIMWVISRPDLITVEEVRSYDIVFAASSKWAEWMSEQSGQKIEPLLQATSPTRFRPDLPMVSVPDDLIFVGGSHGHEFGRAIVGMAIQAGAPLGLWGPGWSRFAPAHAVRGQYLDTEMLPNAYRSAKIVLNDHFPDMARWGFINNRTFDAIACGTPMISDVIEGVDMFDGAVVTADSVESMRDLVNDRSWQPSADKMLALAEMVRVEHSFEARAGRLLEAASSLLGL